MYFDNKLFSHIQTFFAVFGLEIDGNIAGLYTKFAVTTGGTTPDILTTCVANHLL